MPKRFRIVQNVNAKKVEEMVDELADEGWALAAPLLVVTNPDGKHLYIQPMVVPQFFDFSEKMSDEDKVE